MLRPREELELRQLEDLDAGNAAVFLSDGETWSGLNGAMVIIYSGDERWAESDDMTPKGYSVIDLRLLVRHFLQTKP
jgi:hypothetical protein